MKAWARSPRFACDRFRCCSPLFTGNAGGGESSIRQWIIEHDWLEAFVALPEQLQSTQQNTSLYIQGIYEEGELERTATHKKFLAVRVKGTREVKRLIDWYNLDMITSVGYRVKSAVATRFRIWATQRLREFIVKGFVLGRLPLRLCGSA